MSDYILEAEGIAIIGAVAVAAYALWKLGVFKSISDAIASTQKWEAAVQAKNPADYNAGLTEVPFANNPVLQPAYTAGFDAGNSLRHIIVDPLNAVAGPVESQIRSSAPAAYDQGVTTVIGLGGTPSVVGLAVLQPFYAAGFSAGQTVRHALSGVGINLPSWFGTP